MSDIHGTREEIVKLCFEQNDEICRLQDLLAWNGIDPRAVIESSKGAFARIRCREKALEK